MDYVIFQVVMRVDEGTQEEINETKYRLMSLPKINSVKQISKDDALVFSPQFMEAKELLGNALDATAEHLRRVNLA